jgi:Na+-transporting NADH:ubiquinone oxidoreductase subunit NqrE
MTIFLQWLRDNRASVAAVVGYAMTAMYTYLEMAHRSTPAWFQALAVFLTLVGVPMAAHPAVVNMMARLKARRGG